MGKRVLVVDDEPDIIDLLSIWLDDDARCGTVHRAQTLEAALAVAESGYLDAILLDFWVGTVASATVLPALRQRCPGARILIHTGSYAEAMAARVLALGADDILEKATMSVAEVVDRLLD